MQDERRKVQRQTVRDAFSLFIVVPEISGMAKIYLKDISSQGLAFTFSEEHSLSTGDQLNIRLFTNPIFYIEIKAKVVRVLSDAIAVEYSEANTDAAEAIRKLLDFFEAVEKVGQLVHDSA